MISIMSSLIALLNRLPGHECTFAAGDAVFHLGDAVRVIHLVRHGLVHLIRHQPDGSALILQRAGIASILAEASLYSPRYHCEARAEAAAMTWAIPCTVLHQSLEKSPELALAWSRHLAHEVQQARLHAEILSLKTVAARFNAWLAWHGSLPERGRWSAVAYEIGVSPEALYRELARHRRT